MPGRYSFGEGRLLVDTAGLPVLDGAAAGHPGSPELELERGQKPGRREQGSSGTAAAAAAAGRAEGLRAECCILQREGGRNGVSLIHPREEGEPRHIGYFFRSF